MKSDETLPHLRAAAVIYADVQADGIMLHLYNQASDKRKLFLLEGRGAAVPHPHTHYQ